MFVCLCCVQLFLTMWTANCQVPLSMGFSRQQHWGGLLFPSPGDLPNPGIKPTSLVSPVLAGDCLRLGSPGKPNVSMYITQLILYHDGMPFIIIIMTFT